MTGEEKAEFLAAYDQHRVKGQFDWYGARVAEYRRSARQIAWLNELLLFAAAVCGIVAAIQPDLAFGLGIAAAALAALGVALTSWSDVVGFTTNAELYEGTRNALGVLRPDRPDVNASSEEVTEYVRDVERTLLNEVRRWTEETTKAADSETSSAPSSATSTAPSAGTDEAAPSDETDTTG